jgi:hypothetical protein
MSERDAIIQIIAEVMTHKAGDIYGVSVAEKLNLSRAEKAADAIIAARAPSPSSADARMDTSEEVASFVYRLRSMDGMTAFAKDMIWRAAAIIERLAATPAMPAPADAWQHIETAPRDGTPFLCFRPDAKFSAQSGIDLIWYEPSIKTYTMDGDNEVPFAGITHWMPLPMAPVHYGKTK